MSGLLTFGAAYLIRIIIVHEEGVASAGYFQAAWAIGGMFAGFILQAMGTDFYPRLTAIAQNSEECNRVVNEQAQVSILLAGPGLLATLAPRSTGHDAVLYAGVLPRLEVEAVERVDDFEVRAVRRPHRAIGAWADSRGSAVSCEESGTVKRSLGRARWTGSTGQAPIMGAPGGKDLGFVALARVVRGNFSDRNQSGSHPEIARLEGCPPAARPARIPWTMRPLLRRTRVGDAQGVEGHRFRSTRRMKRPRA